MSQLQSHHVHRVPRQDLNNNDNPNDPNDPNDLCTSWYYCSPTAYIIKWVVIGSIALILFLYIVGGYYHAKRRMARGLPPLKYHRWLINRQARERFFPQSQRQNAYAFYGRPAYVPGGGGVPQSYPMHNYGYYPPPPPAYHEAEAVPVYSPPSKVDPDQSYAAVPPAGAPPVAGSSGVHESRP